MSIGITELQLTDVSTILIPTDAILILCLLIVFALLIYFFHNLLDNQTNKLLKKVEDDSYLELVKEKLENPLTMESSPKIKEKAEKQSIKKLNFKQQSKLLKISSLALIAIGGSSLLGGQTIQNSYKGVSTNQIKSKSENQSEKSLLSISKIKSSNQLQTKIKKINYIDPSLSTYNNYKNNNFYQVKESKSEDFFSF